MSSPDVGRAPLGGLKFFRAYPAYTRYWVATVITRFGDSLDSIAYMWMILELTGSTLAMGTIMVANMLPNIILGPFGGVLADRYDRKWTVVLCDAARGLLVMGIAVLFYTGRAEVWMLYTTTVIGSVFETIQAPARKAITPSIIGQDDLINANSMNSLSESVAQLIGIGAAGAIIAVVKTAGAVAIDAVTFWVSAALISTMQVPGQPKAKTPLNIRSFFAELGEGLRFVGGTRVVLLCVILAGLTNFFLGPMGVLMPAFLKLELRLPPSSLSTVYLFETAAMLLGSLLVTPVAGRLKNLKTLRLGFFMLSAGYAALFFARDVISISISLFILGLGVPFASAGLGTFLQRGTPQNIMGRVSAVMSTLVLSAMPLSMAVSGALGERIHAPYLFGGMGLMILLCTFAFTFDRSFYRAQGSAVPAPEGPGAAL